VPYLDILGIAEGCILMVCASLPTLGPLIRVVTGKMTSRGGDSSALSGEQLADSQGRSLGGSRNWDSVKGHRLDSDAEGSSLHLRPSFDAIPLVTAAKPNGVRAEMTAAGIHKTMEVSVYSGEAKR
jgi:hypothetical protein